MTAQQQRPLVWDLPTRSFHWLLVGAFVTAMVSSGSSRHLDVHVFAGYVVLALLLFRVVWGLAGTHYARFRSFAFGPAAARASLHGLWRRTPSLLTGHNPAGAWAIFIMLGLLLAISLSGLLVLGGEEQQGPLTGVLSIAAGIRLHGLHELLAWGMVGVIVLHILGVAVESLLQGENLAASMVHGRKQPHGTLVTVRTHRLLGIALPLAAAGGAALFFHGWLVQDKEHPYLPFTGPTLAQNAQWQEECGACHLAYHPSLLPARSWQRMFDTQAEHFGEDLALGSATVTALRDYALANSADQGVTEAAWRIDHTLGTDTAPLRISATPYWKQRHHDLPATVWQRADVGSKANCAACHRDAAAGTFNDAAMQLPAKPAQPLSTE